MALACVPFILALATKANMITVVTSVSHEKLQVFHRWVAWAMFVLALVHTFPFIVNDVSNGNMMEQWRASIVYWTGVIALLAQAYLTFMSIGPLRDYFIAAGIIYTLCFLYSQLRTFFEYGLSHHANLSFVSNDLLRVVVPAEFSWAPGQHIFIRFITLGIHSLTSHPFTICSLPRSSPQTLNSELVFYIKTRSGLTSRLGHLALKQPNISIQVLLDGPYGGMDTTLSKFDKALIIAGGSGAGFTLPLIEDLLRHLSFRNAKQTPSDDKQASKGPQTEIQVVLSTRDRKTQEWYSKALNELLSFYALPTTASDALHVAIHFTGAAVAPSPLYQPALLNELGPSSIESGGKEISKLSDTSTSSLPIAISTFTARPNLPSIIQIVTSSTVGASVGIAVCGPASMLHDVQNAAAEAQAKILRGGDNTGAREVYLYTEHFS
ncbi:MAG: hypothetical protein M1834_004882 [Cirrosporium novae-zelandiae]|nr:MAG: hypothetical protein M1834_004882 [Cirrosporium novae-zelandiae]